MRYGSSILASVAVLMLPGTGLAQTPTTAAIATTPHFAFYSDLTINLNDALLAAGHARRASKPELFQSGAEKSCFDQLPLAERAGWNRAVDYYAEILPAPQGSARQQLLTRLELIGVVKKEELPNAAERRSLEIAGGFRAVAAPAYEQCRWRPQDASNRRWIDNILPLLALHEKTLAERLPELFAAPWAGLPFRVDVVETVPLSGADSIGIRPAGLEMLVSSSNSANQGRAALEIVFHEACHALAGLNTPLGSALTKAVRDAGITVRGDLTHQVHFFMTGEAVRRVVEKPGEPSYTPYLFANGLFTAEFREAIQKTWPAYMDGKRSLEEAAADLARALAR